MPRGRVPLPPTTALGAAMRERRATSTGEEAAGELGIFGNTYYRLERGAHRPSYDTALKLAAWLGWSVEQVMTAATQPPSTPELP